MSKKQTVPNTLNPEMAKLWLPAYMTTSLCTVAEHPTQQAAALQHDRRKPNTYPLCAILYVNLGWGTCRAADMLDKA